VNKSIQSLFVQSLAMVAVLVMALFTPTNSLFMYASESPADPGAIIVQDGDAGYSEREGVWTSVQDIGYAGSSVRKSGTSSARVMWWLPEEADEGYYTISIYKVVTPDGDPNAVVGVMHSTGAESYTQNWTTGQSGWVTLGTFYMRPGNASTIVSLVRGLYNSGTGNAIVDAVKFEPAPDYTPPPVPTYSNPASDPAYLPDGYELAFADDFDGTSLNTDIWDYQEGTYRAAGTYRPENVTVANGECTIAMKKEAFAGTEYTTGGIISKPSFGFGYYEARLRFSDTGSGFHQSFWLYTNFGNRQTTEDCYDEIDIIETDSSNVNRYYITYHDWHWLSGAHTMYSVNQNVATSSLSDTYHTFGVLYTDTEAHFYMDGNLVGSKNISAVTKGRQSIRLNNVVYETPILDAYLPGEYTIDWVRYYESPDQSQPTTIPPKSPAPPIEPFYAEEFEDGNATDWTPVDGTWAVVEEDSDVYKQTSAGVTAVSYSGDSSWTDYTVTARIKANELPANSASGILARYVDADNNYWLRLHQSSLVQLYKKVNGVTTLLQEAPAFVNSNEWYELTLECKGSALTGYVDGVQKIFVIDDSLDNGCVGVKSYQQSFSVDELKVYEAPVFSDSFEEGDSPEWTSVDGTWSVIQDSTDVYKQTSHGTTSTSIAGDSSWTDYVVTALVKANELPANSASGVLARYVDADNNYWLRLHQSGSVQLYKKVNGVTTLLQESATPVRNGKWYALTLEVNGTQLTGYVDGVQKLSISDSSLENGCLGVKSYQQSFSVDEVKAYNLSSNQPTNPEDPVFDENFESGNFDEWTHEDGSWDIVQDGTNVYKQMSAGTTALSFVGDTAWADYTVEAKVKANELPVYSASGIMARYVDANNNYWLRLHQSGLVQLYKKVGGVTTLLQEASLQVQHNKWYTLKLELNGNQLKGYVDGVLKISTTDNSLTNGCIGVKSYQQSFSIDEVNVYEE
jgi:hypothetical protein